MDINTFVESFGGRIMTPEENREILDFYNSISMSSEKFTVITRKEPDYFRFLKYVSDRHFFIGFPNADGHLEGMAVLIVRPCYINGKPDLVGHFLDLRFKRRRERTITADWKDLALGFTRRGRDIEELNGCRLFHGSYITTNIYATAAIGEDKTAKKEKKATDSGAESKKAPDKAGAGAAASSGSPVEAFQVSNLATYQAVNIYARKPGKALGLGGFKRSSGAFTVSRGREEDRQQLGEFLDKQNRSKTFGYIYAGESDELERRRRDWDGFTMASFFIARDESGEIVGAFGVFDPGAGRQLYIDKIPAEKALLAKAGKMVGLKVPEPNKKIDILYLTTFELDHHLSGEERLDVFDRLLEALYQSGLPGDYHIVSFCDYSRQSLLEVVQKGYMYDATPVLLYQLHAPEAEEVYREADLACPPGHEMVLM
ncbi:MAG: hypothetical protein R6U29_00310 [Desulfosudaceae bacterium]